MNYKSLFNLLYSTEISEATKAEIIDKIQEPVLESCEAEPLVETYLELLDTLVYSTASESLIYNIIDETFSQLSEEVINEVSDEWVKRKVQDSMAARKGAADAANRSVKSGVVGLSQLRKQDQAQSNLEKGQAKAASIQARLDKRTPAAEPKAEAPKAESGAISKLKSAVGKVKSFVSKADKGPDYVGLSRAIGAKANKDNIGAETLRQQTTHKTEAPAEEKQPEVKAEEKQPEVKAEVKADDATKAAKKTSTKASKISKAKKVVADAISNKEDKSVKDSAPNNSNPKLQALHKELADNSQKAQAGDKEARKRFRNARKKIAEIEADLKSGEKYTDVYGNEREAGKSLTSTSNKEEKQPEVKAETEASTEDKTKEARKKRTGRIKINVGSKIKKAEEAPAEEKQQPEAQPSTKEAPQPSTNKTSTKEAPKAQKETTPEGEKPAKAVTGGLYGARAKNEEIKRLEGLISREEPRYQQDMKPGGDSKQAAERMKKINAWKEELAKLRGEATNEALSDLAVLLTFTNISESSFVEVMEMVAASKANAQRALERDEKKAMAAIDDINKDLEAGKPIDPEKVKSAEADHKKYERFKEIYDKKFNDNN